MTLTTVATSTRRQRVGLVALCLGFFVVQLDATIVNVALDAIGVDLGGGMAGRQWVAASYTVALAAGMLTAGWAGDRFGARRVCVLGLVVFAVASVLCTVAPGMATLVAARTLQGVGAAALLPCSLALIVAAFADERERARALGVWGGVASIGLASGPVLGGVLTDLVGWRAIFLVNVPVCVVAAVVTMVAVDEAPHDTARRPDPAGLALGTVALASLTGGLIEAGQLGWTHPVPAALLAGGVGTGIAFVIVERRVATPMLPPGLFASRAFSAGTAVGLAFNFCLYGSLLCVSLYLQGPLRLPVLEAALLVLPLTLVVSVGATSSGPLTARFGARAPMLAGLGAAAVGALVLLLAGRSLPLVVVGAAVVGCCSFAMPAMTSVVMSAVSTGRTALGSGVLNTARQAGGALGASVLGTLLTAGDAGMSLRAPMAVVVGVYVAAIICAVVATSVSGSRPRRNGPW